MPAPTSTGKEAAATNGGGEGGGGGGGAGGGGGEGGDGNAGGGGEGPAARTTVATVSPPPLACSREVSGTSRTWQSVAVHELRKPFAVSLKKAPYRVWSTLPACAVVIHDLRGR